MARKTPNSVQVFMTTCLWLITGAAAQKVYFDCGAVVDVVDVQGLVLSPGFPYNYSSGTHCVWQFFVPVGYQLVMEMFDFDVFESHESSNPRMYVDEDSYTSPTPTQKDYEPEDEGPPQQVHEGTAKVLEVSQKDHVKPLVVQKVSTEMDKPKVSRWAKWLADVLPATPSQVPTLHSFQHIQSKKLNQASRGDGDPAYSVAATQPGTPPTTTSATALAVLSPETQPPAMDTCPHDVLYISDLITFSSRFCGSNNPTGRPMTFGSPDEMVEVIMELITTTHWGRGFALLFRYHNYTSKGDSRLLTPPAGNVDTLLAAVGGIAVLTLVLTSVLCIIFRPKLCAKAVTIFSSNNSELQGSVQNSTVDVGELQLVAPSHTQLDVSVDGVGVAHSLSLSLPHTGSVSGGPDMSHNPELEMSSNGLAELDLGTDEVFVITAGPTQGGLPFCPRMQRDRLLRHSDTTLPVQPDCGSRTRPRAWSVRTFQDLLPPLPQLQRKWCSWNSTSPFTKLVDSTPASSTVGSHGNQARKVFSDSYLEGKATCSHAESSGSTASYPLTQPAQRQRRLNSTSNLRRSRFTAPCFSLLCTPQEGGPVTPMAPSPEAPGGPPGATPQAEVQTGSSDRAGGPVFAITEEEDRQPLVQAEHLGQVSLLNGLAGGSIWSTPDTGPCGSHGPGGGALMTSESPAATGKARTLGHAQYSQAAAVPVPEPLRQQLQHSGQGHVSAAWSTVGLD